MCFEFTILGLHNKLIYIYAARALVHYKFIQLLWYSGTAVVKHISLCLFIFSVNWRKEE